MRFSRFFCSLLVLLLVLCRRLNEFNFRVVIYEVHRLPELDVILYHAHVALADILFDLCDVHSVLICKLLELSLELVV